MNPLLVQLVLTVKQVADLNKQGARSVQVSQKSMRPRRFQPYARDVFRIV